MFMGVLSLNQKIECRNNAGHPARRSHAQISGVGEGPRNNTDVLTAH